jgi:cytochrome-b5 reductase
LVPQLKPGLKLPDPAEIKQLENKAINALGGKTQADLKDALDPKEFRSFKLKKKEGYNSNTSTFTFELPPGHVSGLNVASCVVVKAADDSLKDDKGKCVS